MKTILVTGSTDGIGKLSAIKLAKDGHQLLIHGRNTEKLEKTISEVKDISNNHNIDGFTSDLSEFESIKKMIREIAGKYSNIDVLINNAGVFNSKIPLNQDNLDIRFAVNYFAPYILTNGLLSLLKNGKSSRVINLSSAAQAPVSLEVLRGEEVTSAQNAYAQSKLALTMWSFHFAKKHPELTTIAVNPGSLLNTKMVQEAYGQHWATADKGAAILYELAVSEKYSESSGKYFDNDRGSFNSAHTDAYDPNKIARLISETDTILNS